MNAAFWSFVGGILALAVIVVGAAKLYHKFKITIAEQEAKQKQMEDLKRAEEIDKNVTRMSDADLDSEL